MKQSFSRLLALALAVALVLTCAISGLVVPVAAADDYVATNENILADYTAPEGEFGVGQRPYKSMKKAMEPGRYVLRYEAKGTGAFASLCIGDSWKQANADSGLENWRWHQLYFTLNAAADLTTVQVGNASSTEGAVCSVRNVQLYRVGDFFNLVYGGDMASESRMWAHATDGLSNAYASGAVHTVDPTDPTNTVLKLTRGKAHYIYFNRAFDVGGGYTVPENKVLMVTLRRSGGGILYRRSYHANYASFSYDSTRATALNEWTTDVLYITQEDLAEKGGLYLNLNTNTSLAQAGPYAEQETYIDDLVICEVPLATAIQMSEANVSMFAGASTKLTVTSSPAGSYPGKLTWETTDELVATVKDGTVTAVAGAAVGSTATITARVGNLSASCTVTIKAPTVNQDIYFENNVIKMPAIAGEAYDVTSQLKTALVGYEPTVTMEVTGLTAPSWDSTAKTWTGAENAAVEKVGTTSLRVIKNASGSTNGDVALAHVTPTVTLTDAYGNKAIATVEWEWQKRPVYVDFEGSYKWNAAFTDGDPANHEVVDDGTGNHVLCLTKKSGNVYATGFYFEFKPNTTYRLSFRNKNTDTTGTNNFFLSFGGVDINKPSSGWPYTTRYTTEWVTNVTYFTTGAAPTATGNWMVFLGYSTVSSTNDIYVDDIMVEEVEADKPEIYFENNVVKVPAYASSTYDMSAQLKTRAPGYNTSSQLTWKITDNATTLYGANKDWTGSTMTDAVKISGSKMTIANTTGSNSAGAWSLARVNPTITVSDSFGNTTTAKVEWEWPTTPMHIDFDNVEPSNATMVGAITTEEGTDNKVMKVPTSPGWSNVWFKAQYHLKPNSKYRLSMRTKAMTVGDKAAEVRLKYEVMVDFHAANSGTPALYSHKEGSGEWTVATFTIVTGDSPAIYQNYNHYFATTGNGGDLLVDDIRIDLIEEDAPINAYSDFEMRSYTVANFERRFGNTVYQYLKPSAEGIGGNTTGMLKMNPGIAPGQSTSAFSVDMTEMKAHHAYKISFKHYGDKGVFTTGTWDPTIIEADGNTVTMAASDTWKTYELYYVPGRSLNISGNWPYFFNFGSSDATEPFYIDDFAITEVSTVYAMRGSSIGEMSNPKPVDYDQQNALYGSLTIYEGESSYTKNYVRPIEAGTELTVKVVPNNGYLPVPGTLQVVTLSGKRISVFNTAHESMEDPNRQGATAGTTFKFVAPDETAYVTCEFAPVSEQGFQWGTIATAVRHTDDGKYDGLRSLNRIYVDGLDWSADTLTTTVDGKEFTIAEIGAIARVAADGEVTLDNAERKGLCYSIDNPNGTVKVLDYTDTYFDFSVVIAYKTPVESDATEYQWRAYMILEAADGETRTVYTGMNTDSLDAAISRGA